MSVSVYLLKDVARISGYSIYTVKYYLSLGLINPKGRSPETGFRYFDDAVIKKLQKIRQWRRQEKSLKEIKKLLQA